MGTTEPGDRPEPVAAPLEVEVEAGPGLLRTRRWPVEQRFGRVRLLAQGLFVSAGLVVALIVTHLAVSAPVAPTTPTAPPVGATGGGGAGGAAPAPATATPRPPVTATTRPPVTTTPAPVTTTTVCYSTPSGHVTCY